MTTWEKAEKKRNVAEAEFKIADMRRTNAYEALRSNSSEFMKFDRKRLEREYEKAAVDLEKASEAFLKAIREFKELQFNPSRY